MKHVKSRSAAEARASRPSESRPQKIYSLVRVALLIQLNPPPSSRTSSTLLGLLSSPKCSGLVTRCLSSRARWPGPARGPVCRGTGTAGQQDHQCDGHTMLGLLVRGGGGLKQFNEHRGDGLIEGSRYSLRLTHWRNCLGDEDNGR
ncbi:hypothetical protein DPMN_010594 [Dreissena polymorpha]|uniref:Uncharacterized protein n=1 Tax=Dreissena polymorpha TaxID=45954 RepID=A0A9D4N2C0_DREPO|nr:hypothetical protein DPMN_010594 [Dreissena polymorpha]